MGSVVEDGVPYNKLRCSVTTNRIDSRLALACNIELVIRCRHNSGAILHYELDSHVAHSLARPLDGIAHQLSGFEVTRQHPLVL